MELLFVNQGSLHINVAINAQVLDKTLETRLPFPRMKVVITGDW